MEVSGRGLFAILSLLFLGGTDKNQEKHSMGGASVEIRTEHFPHTSLELYYTSLLVTVLVFVIKYIVINGHQSVVQLWISETDCLHSNKKKIENAHTLSLCII